MSERRPESPAQRRRRVAKERRAMTERVLDMALVEMFKGSKYPARWPKRPRLTMAMIRAALLAAAREDR